MRSMVFFNVHAKIEDLRLARSIYISLIYVSFFYVSKMDIWVGLHHIFLEGDWPC